MPPATTSQTQKPPPAARHACLTRRCWLAAGALAVVHPDEAPAAQPGAGASPAAVAPPHAPTTTLFTFGDSILDCAHYNPHGVHPGQLIVRNDDALFPEFRGRDLQSSGPAALVHRAVDGATVDDLAAQARALPPPGGGRVMALLTVGGNDLLRGLAGDHGPGLQRFEATLDSFLARLPLRPLLVGNVYDPTFGDDRRNFLGVEAGLARANHARVNQVLGKAARRHGGRLVDLHAHFLTGDPGWFERTIEPSLTGASEVRRAFLAVL